MDKGNKTNKTDYSNYVFYHLEKHFRGMNLDDLVSSSRNFPEGLRVDLQIAVNNILTIIST